eukprot:TRINITY_DN29490_c0_g1_i1.p1 TRINITY_DN29490_c0_g1~~TRINITY_DN29490_c0_g1_i1.p1  ORF type:complete len:310 (+),score=59.84 TRINITY_DN29490_c0_g1_i1:81-932(+)
MGNRVCFGPRDKEIITPLGGKLYNLQGRHKPSGRRGEIVGFDRKDPKMTFKLAFDDGKKPELDWYPEADIELRSSPFKISVVAQGKQTIEIADLVANDTLMSLKSKVEAMLSVPAGRAHLMPDTSTYAFSFSSADATRSLGILGLGEGSILTCAVFDYDAAAVRLESACEKGVIGDGGDAETWTISALVYAEKGSSEELLLWAEESVTRAGEEVVGAPQLLDGGFELSTKHGAVSVGLLVAEAKAKPTGLPLMEQLRARFGADEKWPRILARICRKLSGAGSP